jgi:hypothetical protein
MDKNDLATIIERHLESLQNEDIVSVSRIDDEEGVLGVDTESGLFFIEIQAG